MVLSILKIFFMLLGPSLASQPLNCAANGLGLNVSFHIISTLKIYLGMHAHTCVCGLFVIVP